MRVNFNDLIVNIIKLMLHLLLNLNGYNPPDVKTRFILTFTNRVNYKYHHHINIIKL